MKTIKFTKGELLERAQTLLSACIEVLEVATEGDANTNAYLIDQLKTHCSNEHGFLTNNLNIGKVIQKYEKTGELEEEIEVTNDIDLYMQGDF